MPTLEVADQEYVILKSANYGARKEFEENDSAKIMIVDRLMKTIRFFLALRDKNSKERLDMEIELGSLTPQARARVRASGVAMVNTITNAGLKAYKQLANAMSKYGKHMAVATHIGSNKVMSIVTQGTMAEFAKSVSAFTDAVSTLVKIKHKNVRLTAALKKRFVLDPAGEEAVRFLGREFEDLAGENIAEEVIADSSQNTISKLFATYDRYRKIVYLEQLAEGNQDVRDMLASASELYKLNETGTSIVNRFSSRGEGSLKNQNLRYFAAKLNELINLKARLAGVNGSSLLEGISVEEGTLASARLDDDEYEFNVGEMSRLIQMKTDRKRDKKANELAIARQVANRTEQRATADKPNAKDRALYIKAKAVLRRDERKKADLRKKGKPLEFNVFTEGNRMAYNMSGISLIGVTSKTVTVSERSRSAELVDRVSTNLDLSGLTQYATPAYADEGMMLDKLKKLTDDVENYVETQKKKRPVRGGIAPALARP